ncbi:MAG: EamA family transporter [Sphingomonadales bacterium]|nr:EamA family transporter [Sphingomonadales bacterium]
MNHPVITEAAADSAAEQETVPTEEKAAQQADYGLLHPKILFPFLLVSVIWGSTWLVIRDQISTVPPSWSVTYRFITAAAGMFALAAVMRISLRLDRRGQLWAMLIGAVQFAINFNLVYAAEHHITSGLVAVLFALLIVPNALLGKYWLGREVTRRFWIGASIASIGVGLLVLREYRFADLNPVDVLIGAGLTLMAVMCASVANVLQASERMTRFPIIAVLAWAMLYGAAGNALWSLITVGAPVIETRAAYLGGILYLGLIGSVVTFPLYFGLIRDIGPGKAAYTSVFIPVVAMLLSTLFEGYIWSGLAAAGAALAMAGLLISMQARKPSR